MIVIRKNATSEQIKTGTALAHVCEVYVLPHMGPAESVPTGASVRRPLQTPALAGRLAAPLND